MNFISLTFALFLIAVFIIYWLVRADKRWIVLLISSYIFYGAWNTKYLSLIILVTLISYGSALLLQYICRLRRMIMIITVIVCLGLLFSFKYINFFLSSVNSLLSVVDNRYHFSLLNIILPVGISFYTFQALGYVIDVYYRRTDAERHLGKYATFVAFFPQLVAGPIERTENLLPQIKEPKEFSYSRAVSGLEKMLWGAWKKVVVADVLAQYSDRVFANVQNYSGFAVLFATFAFTFQIYCDFSGYSDIAIGTARLLGIELMENFRAPYFSSSLREFWKRWHISLSQWFRDYLYIPLGGNRRVRFRTTVNLLFTFLVSGLWHGASMSFVVWGGVHGIGQLFENGIRKHLNKTNKAFIVLQTVITFLFCAFAWIFFRADTLRDAVLIIKTIPAGMTNPISYFQIGFAKLSLDVQKILLIIGSIAVLAYVDSFIYINKRVPLLNIRPVKWVINWGLALWTIYTWIYNGSNSFVYFQF